MDEKSESWPGSGPCVHTQTARLNEALDHLRALMPWAPDDLKPEEIPSEWKDAAAFLQRQGG